MGEKKPLESQPVGNTDETERGRRLGGDKHKARINNETTLKEVKAKRK